MLKSVETFGFRDRHNVFNTTDTFISILGRYQHDQWDKNIMHWADEGFKIKVLYDDKAINHYVSHRDECDDTEDRRFRQRLVIYEFDEVPQPISTLP